VGKAQRTKGHSFEREIAIRFRELFPGARRGLQYRDGSDASDVIGTPWWVECKHQKNVSIKASLEQAREACGGKVPLVVSRDDRKPIIASMYFDDFINLLKNFYTKKEVEGEKN